MLQSHSQILHSMILIIYILTPFTMTSTVNLFQSFRIIKTRMMVLSVIHGLRPTQKLKFILEGRTNLTIFNQSLGIDADFAQPFLQTFFPVPECLSSFHQYYEHAAQIPYWVRNASHLGLRIQLLQKDFSTQQRSVGPSLSWL